MVSAKLITAGVVVSSASGAAATLHGYAGKYHGLDWYYDSNGAKCRTVQKDDGNVQTVYLTATEYNDVYVTSTYFHCSDGKCSKGTYSTPAPATPTEGPKIVTLTYTQVVDRTQYVKVTYCPESEATSFVPPTTSLNQPKPTTTLTTTQCEEKVYNWWDKKEKCSKKYTHKCSNIPQSTPAAVSSQSSSSTPAAVSTPAATTCVPDAFLYWHPREKCSKTVHRGCGVTSAVPSNTATCTPYEASRFDKNGKCDKKTTVYDCDKPTASIVSSSSTPAAVSSQSSSSTPAAVSSQSSSSTPAAVSSQSSSSTPAAVSTPAATTCVPDAFLYWHPREKCSKTVHRGCGVTSAVPSNTATCTPYEASRFDKNGKCDKKTTVYDCDKPTASIVSTSSTPAAVSSQSSSTPAAVSTPAATTCVPDAFLYWHPREKCSKTVHRGCGVTSAVPSNTATCTPYEASRFDKNGKCDKKTTVYDCDKPTASIVSSSSTPAAVSSQSSSTPAAVSSQSSSTPAAVSSQSSSSTPAATTCVPDAFLYWHPREKCSKTVHRGCGVTSAVPSNTATCTPYEASRFDKNGKCDKKTTVYDCDKPTASIVSSSSTPAAVSSQSSSTPAAVSSQSSSTPAAVSSQSSSSTPAAVSTPAATTCVPDAFLYWHPREKCSKTVHRGCGVTSAVPSNTATCTPYEASRFDKNGKCDKKTTVYDCDKPTASIVSSSSTPAAVSSQSSSTPAAVSSQSSSSTPAAVSTPAATTCVPDAFLYWHPREKCSKTVHRGCGVTSAVPSNTATCTPYEASRFDKNGKCDKKTTVYDCDKPTASIVSSSSTPAAVSSQSSSTPAAVSSQSSSTPAAVSSQSSSSTPAAVSSQSSSSTPAAVSSQSSSSTPAAVSSQSSSTPAAVSSQSSSSTPAAVSTPAATTCVPDAFLYWHPREKCSKTVHRGCGVTSAVPSNTATCTPYEASRFDKNGKCDKKTTVYDCDKPTASIVSSSSTPAAVSSQSSSTPAAVSSQSSSSTPAAVSSQSSSSTAAAVSSQSSSSTPAVVSSQSSSSTPAAVSIQSSSSIPAASSSQSSSSTPAAVSSQSSSSTPAAVSIQSSSSIPAASSSQSSSSTAAAVSSQSTSFSSSAVFSQSASSSSASSASASSSSAPVVLPSSSSFGGWNNTFSIVSSSTSTVDSSSSVISISSVSATGSAFSSASSFVSATDSASASSFVSATGSASASSSVSATDSASASSSVSATGSASASSSVSATGSASASSSVSATGSASASSSAINSVPNCGVNTFTSLDGSVHVTTMTEGCPATGSVPASATGSASSFVSATGSASASSSVSATGSASASSSVSATGSASASSSVSATGSASASSSVSATGSASASSSAINSVPNCGVNTFTSLDGSVHVTTMTEGCPATGSVPTTGSASATGSVPATAPGSATGSASASSSIPANGSASAPTSLATSPVCVPGVHTSTKSNGSVVTVTVVCPIPTDSISESVSKTTPVVPTGNKPESSASAHVCVPGKTIVVEHGETIVSTVVCEATATQTSSSTISTTGSHNEPEQPSSGVTVTTFVHSTKAVESSPSTTVETLESSASGTRSIVVPGEPTPSGSSIKPVVVPSTSAPISQTNASPKLGLNGGMMISALIIAVLMV